MNYQRVIVDFFSRKRWPLYLSCIIVALSQVFTAMMNVINSLIWWGRIDGDLLWIGCIDSLVVTLLISPIAIFLIRHSFNLEEMNRKLQIEIEERRKVTEALKVSEEQSRLLFNSIHEVVYSIDSNLIITGISPSMEKYLGYGKEEFIGKYVYDVRILPDQYYEKGLSHIARVLQGEIIEPEEYEFFTKDGRIVSAEVSGAPIVRNGKIVGMISVARDITARKEAEETRRGLEARLRRAEKMEALGTLAGGVAHDLNNILGVLVGYAELLGEKLSPESLLKRYADNILQSGLKGAAIIQDLLTLARRGVAVAEVVDLNRIVSDYLKTPEFEKLGLEYPEVNVRVEQAEGLLRIQGSPIHLGKTIANLVSNAAEAISGRGEIAIRTENRYLDVPLQGYDPMREGDFAVLTVSDTGKGIPAGDIGKIFEPFYTNKVMGRGGTGLGLAVVWGTVKDHHGYIDVRSEEGKGSAFTLYFPPAREETAERENAVDSSAYRGKGEAILVVDDVREQRELAVGMLRRLGYQAEAVAGGEEAIDYLRGKKADLMVLDMIMEPGIDGLETYRRVLETTPGQKAVIVSGFSETDRVRKVQEMGAGAFVRKPYVLQKIGQAIRNELDRK